MIQQEKGEGGGERPGVEMIASKAIEMFAEAIPGVFIQLMAIATSDKVSAGAWTSLVVSLLSTGFISATISYDFDTDPRKRLEVPEFYGYVPTQASKRTIVFGSMTLFTAGMLTIRCTSLVLLALLGKGFVAVYILADLGVYMMIKIARKDFWYWMPTGGKRFDERNESRNFRFVEGRLCTLAVGASGLLPSHFTSSTTPNPCSSQITQRC